jgi:hypothetical protein
MAVAFIDYRGLLDTGTLLTLALAGIVALNYIRTRKTSPVPPGPRGIPLVGNVFDAPTERHWLKFAELGDIWGMFQLALTALATIQAQQICGQVKSSPSLYWDRP